MNRKLRPTLSLLAVAGFALVAAACDGGADPLTCTPIANVVASTSGDTAVTTSGLKYRDLIVGTGAQVATTEDCQVATVTYGVRLINGSVFETGSFDFYVGGTNLITGFTQGVVGMRVGGTRQLIVPPALGYGNQDQRDGSGQVIIPANSTLVFDVQLTALN